MYTNIYIYIYIYICALPGECVSVDGTHLGHNIPDGKNRYCINLVSVSGNPV